MKDVPWSKNISKTFWHVSSRKNFLNTIWHVPRCKAFLKLLDMCLGVKTFWKLLDKRLIYDWFPIDFTIRLMLFPDYLRRIIGEIWLICCFWIIMTFFYSFWSNGELWCFLNFEGNSVGCNLPVDLIQIAQYLKMFSIHSCQGSICSQNFHGQPYHLAV